MPDYFVSDVELTDVADAIREKGGTSAPLEWPGGFVEAIGDISGGGSGGGSLSDPIRFFDYDGTLVASYKTVPSALPDNPSHSGLIAQGWNYTLAQIQTQFAASGTCDIGQMYITESGDTEIDIVLQGGRLSPYLGLAPNGTVVIDWGDGSATSTVTGNKLTTQKRTQHNYASAGSYTIKVHVSSGTVALYGTSSYYILSNNATTGTHNLAYSTCVQAVRIGQNTVIGNYALYACYSLTSVSIPSSITSIGTYAFYYCYSLTSISIPSGITSVSTYMLYSCYSLSLVSIPSSVTSIGSNAFYYCSALASISIPSGVTAIDNTAFQYCYSLSSILVPDGITAITNYFAQYCPSLASINIPSDVESIGAYAFRQCYSLASVTIPAKVTSIGNFAFGNCYGLAEIHFLPTSPPAVSSSNAFSLQSDCKIYVPAGSLSAYTSKSTYPSSSTYTYIEE